MEGFDWKRILFGDQPPLFYLEILFRTGVIYVYTFVLLRWLGSRTIGQLSTIEFLLVIALGSAVGDAMFYPDVPLAHALLVITAVVLANKALDLCIDRSAGADRIVNGVPVEAIRNGVVSRGFLAADTLSRNELFQQLRERGISQLGEVEHAYLETDGGLTIFRAEHPRPGLPIVPPWEVLPRQEFRAPDAAGRLLSCTQCGCTGKVIADRCRHCGHDAWIEPGS